MKSALAALLLALVPLSSVRMVCVTSHDLVARTTVNAVSDDDECARVCKRHPAAKPAPPPAPAVECLLVADPFCEYLGAGAIAVLTASPLLPREQRSVPVDTFVAFRYPSAIPARLTPPPRTAA